MQAHRRRAILRRLTLDTLTTLSAARPGEDGIFRPAAHQRPDARLDLRPHRHRLHDGVRHHRHGELRARRRVHGVGLHRAHPLPAADGRARHYRARHRALTGARARHGADRAVELGDRTHRLSAPCGLVPPRPSHLRDRHVGVPVELRAGGAGPAQQAGAAPAQQRDLDPRWRRLGHAVGEAGADHGGDGRAARRLLGRGAEDAGSAARSVPASRTGAWRRCSASTSTTRCR